MTSKHCSEAVCILLLHVADTITDVACNASTPEQRMVNTLRTSRRLPAPQCYYTRDKLITVQSGRPVRHLVSIHPMAPPEHHPINRPTRLLLIY